MSQEHELPSDSDEDDEDYVPEGAECEPVSEVESDGDAESAQEDENDENKVVSNKEKDKKRKKEKKRKAKRRKQSGIDKNSELEPEAEDDSVTPTLTEEEEKKRADSLWADFMKDTGTKSTAKPVTSSAGNQSVHPPVMPKPEEKIKITKIFEFAGEQVKVEKEVPANSVEARLSLSSEEKEAKNSESSLGPSSSRHGCKRPGLGGISSVLGQLGKKAKISTLEKSKLDWDNFKREENINEELNTHNRGKNGYLERQDFLLRADIRCLDVEKQLRLSRRSKR